MTLESSIDFPRTEGVWTFVKGASLRMIDVALKREGERDAK